MTHPTIPHGTKEQEMSEELKPCPFCGSTNLKSGGDDKIVGTWCLDCEAAGPNQYGCHEWNTRTPPRVKALAWHELRQHKLGSGPYEVACNDSPANPDAMWRVKFYDKVVCKQIKGVDRATAWANDHNTRRVLASLEGYDD